MEQYFFVLEVVVQRAARQCRPFSYVSGTRAVKTSARKQRPGSI
jgi:hypothetical protein